jgi:hypothetical protein
MLDLTQNLDDSLVRFIELLTHKIGLNSTKRLFITKHHNPILCCLTIERETFTASLTLVDAFLGLARLQLNTFYAFIGKQIAFMDYTADAESQSIVIVVVSTDLL